MLKALLVAFCLTWPVCCETVAQREERENVKWVAEIRRYAQSQPENVRQALEQIIQDGLAMGKLSQHKQHDTLQATLSKIDRAAAEPDGALERERLDSPVSNFGEVVPGKLYRGGQPSPQALRWLKDQGVGTIILLREPGVEETNYPDWTRQDYLASIKALGMNCVELVIRDHTVPTPAQINQFLRTVAESQVPVYFHCSAGVGRTGIMAGLYERSQGVSPEEALRHSKRFQLNPALVPDHALQASLIANYPLPGHNDTLDLPWAGMAGAVNPVKVALANGRGVSVPHRLHLDLQDPEPALKRLAEVLRSQEIVCLEFRTPEEVDLLASLARVVPVAQKIGSLKLGEGLSMEDLDRARRLLGPVPFEVVLSGEMTPARMAQLEGHCEIVDVGVNPPEAVLEEMAKHGLYAHLRPDPKLPLAHYEAVGIGFLRD
ncbi:MAG: tyrosine-protein phosphatase [Candidatus Eremiobacteraeota bacterium]|nr:tyrosine-protein phosphatase [Candidatus Eremiobacteraeota bacterium]MCW5866829.1 tyrosine-protein phosphatase [Candidatus Eremiobacteraeota bacterium]